MAKKRPTRNLAVQAAVPETDEVADELVDVRVNELAVTWSEDADDPHTTIVRMVGEYVFDIHEEVTDEGKVVYTSGMFQTEKDDLKAALELGVKNAAKRSFIDRYDFLFPPQPRVIVRRNYKAENDIQKRQIAEMRLAMKEKREPNWEVAGVPAPDDWGDE